LPVDFEIVFLLPYKYAHMKKVVVCLLLTAMLQKNAFSQMTIGAATAPNVAAVLDLSNATRMGIYPPQVTLQSINDITTITSPPISLLVYNTTATGTSPNNVIPGFYYWNGVQWIFFANSGAAIVTANNGLNVNTGNNVQLGGALITPTTISGDNINNLTFTSSGTTGNPFSITANTLTAANAMQISANGLTTGSGLNITSSSTAGTGSNSSNLISLLRSGANVSASHTAIGIASSVTNTGTTSTNIAGYFKASGGTNNAAINTPSGGGQVIINQAAAANSNLTMVTNGSTYADNQVSSICMWTASATWNLSTNGTATANYTDLSGTDAIIEPSAYRPDGNIDVKLVVYYQNGSANSNFQLHAYQINNAAGTSNILYPIYSAPTTAWTYYQVNGNYYSATSAWVNWAAGTNGWEIILNAANSGANAAAGLSGTDNIRNVYLLVRPHNN
jgi:trimeric autotransporter adhesin